MIPKEFRGMTDSQYHTMRRDYQDYVRECVHYGEEYVDMLTYAKDWIEEQF